MVVVKVAPDVALECELVFAHQDLMHLVTRFGEPIVVAASSGRLLGDQLTVPTRTKEMMDGSWSVLHTTLLCPIASRSATTAFTATGSSPFLWTLCPYNALPILS